MKTVKNIDLILLWEEAGVNFNFWLFDSRVMSHEQVLCIVVFEKTPKERVFSFMRGLARLREIENLRNFCWKARWENKGSSLSFYLWIWAKKLLLFKKLLNFWKPLSYLWFFFFFKSVVFWDDKDLDQKRRVINFFSKFNF